MTGFNGQPMPAHAHPVDLPAPYAPGTPVVYDVMRMTVEGGMTVIRLVFKKPGHAITLDFELAATEELEKNLRAARTGLVLP
jgi:hypothetical protein